MVCRYFHLDWVPKCRWLLGAKVPQTPLIFKVCFHIIIAPLWKSAGYTGFALSFMFCDSVTFQIVILWFRNLSNFSASHFSQELWGLEGWNLVHTWTVGRCIVYTEIRLLLLICPFISSIFFLSNFQTLKCFVTLFAGTVRPRRVKLGTRVDSGQMYHVYRNQAAATYLSLYFFIFLSLQFSNIKIISSHFSQELWGLEEWNLVHTWTVGSCTEYTESGCCLCLFVPLFLHFSFSPVFKLLFFYDNFAPELRGIKNWNNTNMKNKMYCVYCNQVAHTYLSCYFFPFSVSPIFSY